MIKVTKFGGSSVANAKQFAKVKHIIDSDPSRKFIVTSACGKESHEDHKVTDLLYLIQAHIKYGVSYESLFDMIVKKYKSIQEELHLHVNLDEEFLRIRKIIQNDDSPDYLVSRGEYLTGKLLAEYLGAKFVDAADVVMFHYDGTIDMKRTSEKLMQYVQGSEKILIPGFYGATPNGTIKVMSRGGSDITGAVLANIVDADVYENWTDVSGFMVVDPRIIPNPISISRITYSELREMSYMGANVLHDDSVFPVREKNIPINIRNTNRPLDKGTMIVESTCNKPKFTITGIAGKKGLASINIEKDMMNSEIGFGRKVLQVFEENHLSFEHVPSGIDTFTVYVHQDEFEDKEQNVIAGLHRAVQPDSIDLESDLALIAVVGRGMRRNRGTAARIFAALAHNHVNVKMIDQGSSELNIIIGVENRDFETAIRAIYDIFVLSQI